MATKPQALPARRALRLAPSWADALRVAFVAFAASRLLVLAATAVAHARWGDDPRVAVFDPGRLSRPFDGLAAHLTAVLGPWDGVWYLVIANDGYGGEGAREAFFPLYPLLVDAVAKLVDPPLLAGALVSAVCCLVAFAVVHRLAALELGGRAAGWAVWALALFPVSFFLTTVYSEALFLALSAGAVLAARTDRWLLAGALGALAAATRSAGVVLVVGLAVLWWRSSPRRPADLAAVGLVPLGLVAFCAGLALAGEGALSPFSAQEDWFRVFAGPLVGAWDGAVAAFQGTRQLLSGGDVPRYFDKAGGDPTSVAWVSVGVFATLLAAVAATVGAWRRLPAGHGAYATAALLLPLSWPVAPQPLMSLPRFVLVLFPLFLWAGLWLARGGAVRRAAWLGLSAALLVLCAGLHATWHFVA